MSGLKSYVSCLPFDLKLAVMIMEGNGNSHASDSYLKKKLEIGRQLGITVESYRYKQHDRAQMILDAKKISRDSKCHGLSIHLPLPKSVSSSDVLDHISTDKDVDAVTTSSLSEVEKFGERARVIPCVSQAVLYVCDRYSIDLRRKNTVVIGTSAHLGRPLIHILRKRGAEVSSFDERSDPVDLRMAVKRADIVVSATGKSHLIN